VNEMVQCLECMHPGLLLLGPRVVEHPQGEERKSLFCQLPPLDVPVPDDIDDGAQRPTWVEYYGRVAS
jgi:hypothetical protein